MTDPNPEFPAIDTLTRELLEVWWACDPSPPILPQQYTRQQQATNEGQLREMLEGALQALAPLPDTEADREAVQRQLLPEFTLFARQTLGVTEAQIDCLMASGMRDVGRDFGRAARAGDPEISGADVFQALRNVWAMNGIQLFLGLPVALTPSIFAYSMLYPYTDNYLDDEIIPPDEKSAFNRRFGQRLRGEDTQPANAHEARIFAMIEMMEEEHDRASYPLVYDSLLAIHAAQAKSLRLLAGDAAPYEIDVLGIALAKGGASVVADGYLVARTLTPEQARFFFGWGAVLQLADDLQDVERDRRAGLQTIFSQAAGRWPLDRLTSRAMHLAAHVLQGLDTFDAPGIEPLKALSVRSVMNLFLYAAGGAHRHHSKRYLATLEQHTPFRFSAVRRAKRRLERHRADLEAWYSAW